MTRRWFVLMVALGLTCGLDSAPAWSLERPTAQSAPTGSTVRGARIASYPQPVDNSPLAPQKVKKLTRSIVLSIFDQQQWECVAYVIERESHWNVTADNKHSTAYGIGQVLNSEDNTGTNALKQIEVTLNYMIHRYNTPCGAAAFHKKHRWY